MRRDQAMTEQLAEVNATLRRLAQADVLTGVANRRHFREHLQQVWERASVDGSPMSVLMLDVDHFKAYNDHHGHPAGDACLQIVAAAVSEHVRVPMDFVARYGGEEFVAVLPGATREVALLVAERVRQGVMDKALPHSASPTAGVVTVSVGVATSLAPGTDCPDADRLVGRADRALYDAKRGARNRVMACIDNGTDTDKG
jgi:diguanylate cyclase (GGDEF)-like protein